MYLFTKKHKTHLHDSPCAVEVVIIGKCLHQTHKIVFSQPVQFSVFCCSKRNFNIIGGVNVMSWVFSLPSEVNSPFFPSFKKFVDVVLKIRISFVGGINAEEGNSENRNIETETQNATPSNSEDANFDLHWSEGSEEGFEEDIHSSMKEQQAHKRKRLLNSSSESDENTPDRRRPKKSLVSSLQRKHTRTNFLSSLEDLSDADD